MWHLRTAVCLQCRPEPWKAPCADTVKFHRQRDHRFPMDNQDKKRDPINRKRWSQGATVTSAFQTPVWEGDDIDLETSLVWSVSENEIHWTVKEKSGCRIGPCYTCCIHRNMTESSPIFYLSHCESQYDVQETYVYSHTIILPGEKNKKSPSHILR